jgi:pilus assembly protein Flp/PilA
MKSVVRFLRDEEGVTAVEYALVAGLISVAIIAGATALGGELSAYFQALATYITGLEPG